MDEVNEVAHFDPPFMREDPGKDGEVSETANKEEATVVNDIGDDPALGEGDLQEGLKNSSVVSVEHSILDINEVDDKGEVIKTGEKIMKRDFSEKNRARKNKKRRNIHDSHSSSSDDELNPTEAKKLQAERDIQEVLNRIKSGSRRRNNCIDDFAIDTLTYELTKKMREAAEEDIRLNQIQRPAIEKLKLFPWVKSNLTKIDLSASDSVPDILSCIKLWLEPLPDGTLPGFDVQLNLLEILRVLTVTVDDLRESLIGRIVKFYEVSDRPVIEVRKIAARIIDKWISLVVRKNDSSRYHGQSSNLGLRRNDKEDHLFNKKNRALSQHPAYDIMPFGDNESEIYNRLKKKIKTMNFNSKLKK